ncbi:acyl-CoA dehydrogenase family protein [Nocardia sp. CC201C]|uniref:acyl-CoA dehydrogenase family protein n=1 Tax=Nocardia sp. CC201C TaxID=3044575 RepID=UPI0024A7C937|nr:acyl-CoA dehydrogenase family protein [Nocardia sp. CC201C]
MTTETTDLDTLRQETEAWVRARLPESWVRTIDSGATGTDPALADPAAAREWYTALCERGWAVPHWPVEYGGAGLSDAEAAVVAAVIARYRADLPGPYFVSRTLIGPTVMAWGSPEQRRHYLPGIAAGTDVWCQLFSEPGAGSDLAGLATRATSDGDRWIVRGQKVWSSFADRARYGMLLARTHPERPKHAGISCFLLDMHTPGVTVRPLRQLTGEQHFCEVFLDEVVVPDTDRLGGVGEGWRVALSTLSAERSGLSDSSEASGVPLAPVLALARATGGWRDPVLRDRLTALLVTERALHLTTLRNRASAADGPRGSITKLAQSELSQRISEIGYEIAGARAAYSDDAALTPGAYALLDSRRLTIAGGTSEIQRTIIAERVLGLDREPDPVRGRPWNETRHG